MKISAIRMGAKRFAIERTWPVAWGGIFSELTSNGFPGQVPTGLIGMWESRVPNQVEMQLSWVRLLRTYL